MHHILFNIDSHMESKYSSKINHIIFSNIHNSYIGIMALQNHSFANIAHIATMWIFHSQIYISHMLKARISLINFAGIKFVSSCRELVNQHLFHLKIYGHGLNSTYIHALKFLFYMHMQFMQCMSHFFFFNRFSIFLDRLPLFSL